MKTQYFTATSLDGFIARPDGAIDWLERANETVPEGQDCGQAGFMGSGTFDEVMSFPE